jgi:hypothetical protein
MALSAEAVDRSQAYIRSQDAFHDVKDQMAVHAGTGNHLPATISAVEAAGSLAVMGWRALALVRIVNGEHIKVNEDDNGNGPTRALAEAIIANNAE